MRDYLYTLQVIHGHLHDWWEHLKTYELKLLYPFGKKYFILGTPIHKNIGDSAIVLAEQLFLERITGTPKRIKELTVAEVKKEPHTFFRYIHANRRNVICWHGGGNLGDQWLSEEEFRRMAMEQLPQNPMVVFPQTIFYTPTERGEAERQISVSYYNERSGLVIAARENMSYSEMLHLYPKTKIILVPDMVLSCKMEDFGVLPQERDKVLFCVRSDAEKSIKNEVWEELRKELYTLGETVCQIDMYSASKVTKENRKDQVKEKMQEFCSAKLVITDRLHGMVFAAITETPCIVFSNYNHKVKGTYEWIHYLPYIRYVETIEDAKQVIPELLSMHNCRYDNTPLMQYYEKLAEVVRSACRKSV